MLSELWQLFRHVRCLKAGTLADYLRTTIGATIYYDLLRSTTISVHLVARPFESGSFEAVQRNLSKQSKLALRREIAGPLPPISRLLLAH